MKKFKLISLNITNFKGIQKFSLHAEGNDLVVKGRNGSGKTTLFDAFTWLLFGRDSANRTQFEIKTLNEDGKVKQHGIEHSVEGAFSLDDKQILLKRVYKEEWTKHRGSAKKTFTGHTTKYFIDDVPVKKKEYDNKISEIVSDDIFKLLTNPMYFNEHLDQKQRRTILMDMVDDVTEQDVAEHSGNQELFDLIDRLEGKSIEQYQKVIKSKQREINKELDRIPIRIDEIMLSLPDTDELNEKEIEADIQAIDSDIEEKQLIISNIRSGGQVSEYKKQLSDIDMELTEIKNAYDHSRNDEIYKLKAKLQESKSNVTLLTSKIDSTKEIIKHNESSLKELEDRVNQLRLEWVEVNDEPFEYEDELICPTCKQELQEEKVQEAREQAEKQFNEKKANKLESIVAEGETAKKQMEISQDNIKKANNTIEKYQKEIEKNNRNIGDLEESIKQLEENQKDITEDEAYSEKLKEKERIEQELANVEVSAQDSIDSIKAEIKQLEDKKKELQMELSKFDTAKRSESRLKELEKQEEQLSAEYEQLEKEIYLSEEFTRSKIDLLEERINAKFKYAEFKLFEEQVNGGLKETCDTLYKGVPYNRGLNNASRINIGLDIINTLNSHYGIEVPIFIDNRESVTDLIDVEAQTVSLVVDKNAEILQVTDHEDIAV